MLLLVSSLVFPRRRPLASLPKKEIRAMAWVSYGRRQPSSSSDATIHTAKISTVETWGAREREKKTKLKTTLAMSHATNTEQN
jgi:hypothetical protein